MGKYFGPYMTEGGAVLNLSYLASEKVVPGYGGGMSSAKAALESDTRVLAYEAGRKFGIRVNAISAGALGSRAASEGSGCSRGWQCCTVPLVAGSVCGYWRNPL